MPPPIGPQRPSPEELARRIAERLAEQGPPSAKGFSWRTSVLIGRLVSGLIVLATAAALVLGVYAGVDLLLDSPSPPPPQVLSAEISADGDGGTTTALPTTRRLEDFIGVFVNPDAAGGGLADEIPGVGGIGVLMPPASTTSTSSPVGQSSTSTTNPSQVTTTQTSATTTSVGSITTSTSITTVPKPTLPSTTTSVPAPTTVVTITTTTTTEASTTTLVEETTTTCGNNGNGKGNC